MFLNTYVKAAFAICQFVIFTQAESEPPLTCDTNQGQKQNGDTWEANGAFLMKCISSRFMARTKILACIWNKSGQKININIGESKTIGSTKAQCLSTDGGGAQIKIAQVPTSGGGTQSNGQGSGGSSGGGQDVCDTDQGPKHDGEEWEKNDMFVKKCSISGGMKRQTTVACLYDNSGQKVRINRGSEKIVRAQKIKCVADGQQTRLDASEFVKCPAGNGFKNNGEEWESSIVVYKCKIEGGKAKLEIIACYWKEQSMRIPIGESKKVGTNTAECVKSGQTVNLKKGSARFPTPTDPIPHSGGGQDVCDTDYGPKHDGEEWEKNDMFVKKCSISGGVIRQTTVACLWDNSGQKVRIPRGSEKVVGPLKIKCVADGQSTGLESEYVKCPAGNGFKNNGEEWESSIAVYKCKIEAGRPKPEIIACYWKEQSMRIPIGESKKVGTNSAECIKSGQSVRLKKVSGNTSNGGSQSSGINEGPKVCETNEGTKQNGAEWETSSGFVKKCTVSGGMQRTEVIACTWGKPGQKIRISRGSEKIVGPHKIKCVKNGQSTGLETSFVKCPVNGENKMNGEEFQSKFLVYKCKISAGSYHLEAISCFWKEKSVRIPIGGSKTVGDITAKCIKTGSGYRLQKASAKKHYVPPNGVQTTGTCQSNYGTKQNGEEWVHRNFVKKCVVTSTQWRIKTIGCIWRTDGQELRILIGGSKIQGAIKASCNQGNDQRTHFKREYVKCPYLGGIKSTGETWEHGQWELVCKIANGRPQIEASACIWLTDGQKIRIPFGSEKTQGALVGKCMDKNNRKSFKQEYIKCPYQGRFLSNGEEFKHGNFVYACKVANGYPSFEAKACYWIQKSMKISFGDSKVIGKEKGTCTKNGSHYSFNRGPA